MPREQRYRAIILKKQPYGEGDEIITCFAFEHGKVRVVAKSTKYAKSKLQYSLQALFLVNLTVSGSSSFARVIGAEVGNSYPKIRESLEAVEIAFYAVELVLKFTPDEQKNESLFNLLAAFFDFLNDYAKDPAVLSLGLAKFKALFLETLGLALAYPENSTQLFFSNSKGGFVATSEGADHMPVSPETLEQLLLVRNTDFKDLHNLVQQPVFAEQNTIELQEILSGFLRYQLERDIKSERYIDVL